MMMGPQIVGVLLKKPGQKSVSQNRSEDTKIRGELYVEELGERRIVSIRMGWLWVEGTPMRLALRALNLRQTSPGICQPHALALGFTLSNSKADPIATFWADSEAIYWSWVRAIAAELIRQTPFRAQRCLNFLEILTICPRGPVPLPDSPSDIRRRSRSELRCWPSDSPPEKDLGSPTALENSRRRARSELRCWSSSTSSDEDLMGDFRSIPHEIGKMGDMTRTWGCSESSEGSDDSLPWTGTNIISNIKSLSSTISFPEAPTREQRIQRYKEARRRENEARTKRVLEEDARRRKARALETNSDLSKYSVSKLRCRSYDNDDGDDNIRIRISNRINRPSIDVVDSIPVSLPPIKPIIINNNNVIMNNNNLVKDYKSIEDSKNNNNINKNNNQDIYKSKVVIERTDSSERRSRARERRNFKPDVTVVDNKDRLSSELSRIPIPSERSYSTPRPEFKQKMSGQRTLLPAVRTSPCEKDVARLLERCQRVDHYVPVKEKLTLFESLSRMGGRLARSTEDLGRSSSKPSPTGKQRASSLHDLNRAIRTVPVREMCRLFENQDDSSRKELNRHPDPPCVRASTRRKQYK